MKTSHASNLSSGGCPWVGTDLGEGGALVVLRAGGEAVVEDADHAVEQVALGGDVAVAGGLAAVVVGPSAGGGSEGGEGPEVADAGQALVLDAAVHDGRAL